MSDDPKPAIPESAESQAESEERKSPENEAESEPSDAAPARKVRVDEDGLPLDRAVTLDDVRSTEGMHGRYALGCTIAIVALIVAFWLIRGGLGG